MSDPVKLVSAKSDYDIAEELKNDTVIALEPIMAVLAKAKAHGFDVTFSIGPGPLGKPVITAMKVSKEY